MAQALFVFIVSLKLLFFDALFRWGISAGSTFLIYPAPLELLIHFAFEGFRLSTLFSPTFRFNMRLSISNLLVALLVLGQVEAGPLKVVRYAAPSQIPGDTANEVQAEAARVQLSHRRLWQLGRR